MLTVGQPQEGSTKPAFDVVSIKPNLSSGDLITLGGPDLGARNVPVRNLVQFAYNVQDFLISGGPGWINLTVSI
jgi:uncharacterized protein (TIGR03435 family)